MICFGQLSSSKCKHKIPLELPQFSAAGNTMYTGQLLDRFPKGCGKSQLRLDYQDFKAHKLS